MIVLVGGEKGGTGKTTLATNLAAMRAGKGKDILLLDTDKQLTASYWAQMPPGTCPRWAACRVLARGCKDKSRTWPGAIRILSLTPGAGFGGAQGRAGHGGPADIPLAGQHIRHLDLEPDRKPGCHGHGLQPGAHSQDSAQPGFHQSQGGESQEAQEALRVFEQLSLAQIIVRDRIAFRKAAREGLSVAEMPGPDPKAAAEIKSLYKEVFDD